MIINKNEAIILNDWDLHTLFPSSSLLFFYVVLGAFITPWERFSIQEFLKIKIISILKVRAAAVTALAKFGAECPKLRPNIIILLKRCLLDTDDEVRDRATLYLSILKSEDQTAIVTYILDTLKVCFFN